jgi:hypothetical protein
MDDFDLGRSELAGSLITMEFGTGARINQLWAADPNNPDGEEFQFVCAPMPMGDEQTEDYFPGTIMLGARMHPEDPWILSRNSRVANLRENAEDNEVVFDYEFAFLDEIGASGRFYEVPGTLAYVAWDLTLENRSRRSVEIGELAFPFALNNVLEGYPLTDKGMQELWANRVLLHKHIGGAASYLFAQRLSARPPGMIILPGVGTGWEFYNYVPSSLHTPFHWEGVPVMYVHSRAVIEREGWGEWFAGHTSTILEPGESRNYQTLFVPAERNKQDHVSSSLAMLGKPAMRLYPGAVSPVDVGISVEVAGVTPTRFYSDVEVETETDSDDEGGFCFVRPKAPGPVRLGFEDTREQVSEAFLLFTPPIEDLITARARYVLEHQFVGDAKSPLYGAFLAVDNGSSMTVEPYGSEYAVESSLSEALFLAEKNVRRPVTAQISALDVFLERFLEDRLRNPGTGEVASYLPADGIVGVSYGRRKLYPVVVALYESMARVSAAFGAARSPEEYLAAARDTALRLFALGPMPPTGIPMMPSLSRLEEALRDHGMDASALRTTLNDRARQLARRRYPFASSTGWSMAGFEEALWAAQRLGETDAIDRILRCLVAGKSLSPAWWWYGSDKYWAENINETEQPNLEDRGELCLGPTSVANSLLLLQAMEREGADVPEPYARAAFGGAMGIWALIREDGAGSAGYCPDSASAHYGMSWITGTLGQSLYRYLRSVSALLLAGPGGATTFGCQVDTEQGDDGDTFVLRTWDGVGRRVVVREMAVDVEASAGVIREVRFDGRKRWLRVVLQNPSEGTVSAVLAVRGLWGREALFGSTVLSLDRGAFRATLDLPPGEVRRFEFRVQG